MKNSKKVIGIAALAVLTILIFFRLASNKQITKSNIYQYNTEKPITVSTDTIRLQIVTDTVTYTGTFEPNRETKIAAEIHGRINMMAVDAGSSVNMDQIIIQLDNSLLKLQLQAVQVQIDGLEDDVRRYTVLAEADAVQGVQLEKAKLGLKSAQVQKTILQEQINKTSIKAPFGGIVTAKLSEVGGFAASGLPLLQITDISSLRFTINIPENNLAQFQLYQSYPISADAFPDTNLTGKVVMIGSKANTGNSFPIQIQVNNTKRLDIKSGMFGKVKLSANKQEQGILIPSSAVVEENGSRKVYVVKEGKAMLKEIYISKYIGDNSLIKSGLIQGDKIVTNGFANLFNGANIVEK